MRTAYNGVPVVESVEELPRVVAELGIVPWTYARPEPMDLGEYRAMLDRNESPLWSSVQIAPTPEEMRAYREEAGRFAPKAEVLFLVPPGGTKIGTYFRSTGRDWASVFAPVPDPKDPHVPKYQLVPVVAEWKHGAEEISIGPPAGVPKKGETMEDCGRREFMEETGFELESMEALAGGVTTPVSGRQTTQGFRAFLGKGKTPVVRGESRLDDSAYLKLMLVPLPVWLEVVAQGLTGESSAIVTTFLALRKLRLL